MSHPTILLIDFDSSSIDHARSSLTQAGYHVEVACDGVSGVEAFERLKPDLVLVEAILPKKHGFQVCQEIKNTPYGKCTPILITSSEALGAKYVQDALQLYGCDEYVEKPVSDVELVGFCQRLLPEVVVTPPPGDEPLESNGDRQRLDDLSEDELMQRLDQLIDRATRCDNEPSIGPSDDEMTGASVADSGRRPLGEVDLVSFCERVFPRPDRDDVPEPGKAQQLAPAATGEKAAERLLNEEEVMGRLDALARNDSPGGLPAKARSPIKFEVATAAVESMVDFAPSSAPAVGWTAERRSKLVWRTGVSGAVLVAVGLLLLAVARGHLPVESANPADLTLAGPLATPPVAGDANVEANGPSAVWDSTPAEATSPAAWKKAPQRVPRRAAVSTPKRQPEPKVAARPAPETTAPPASLPQTAGPAPESVAPGQTAGDVVEPVSAALMLFSEPTRLEASLSSDAAGSSLIGLSTFVDAPASSTIGEVSSSDPAMFPAFEPASEASPPLTEPAPAVATRRGELIPIESVDRQPIPLERPLPVYDNLSRRMRRQGTVVLKALIDERGAIDDVQLVQGIPRSRLNDAAIEAVRSWRYSPATKDGVAVKVWKTISVEFKP